MIGWSVLPLAVVCPMALGASEVRAQAADASIAPPRGAATTVLDVLAPAGGLTQDEARQWIVMLRSNGKGIERPDDIVLVP